MNDNIIIKDQLYSDSMYPNGWIVIVALSSGEVHYGPFANKDEAVEYGRKMVNATIYRLYFPTLH